MIRTFTAALITSTCIVALATPAAAQTREYNIPAGSLKSALDAYVRQSGRQVVYRADEVRSARSPGVRGQQSAEAALTALLAGSGFATRIDGKLVAIVRASGNGRADPAPLVSDALVEDDAEGDASQEIVVTGSHIRGNESASPVIQATRADIEKRGLSDLGAFARTVPQNFGGGQNPGIFSGGNQGGSQNLNSSSNLNLRGLGPDATLTLLNGHRVAYDGVTQGVDISSIPLAAIDRLEIVADGSSALYGSDAVGGVANIILRQDYAGLTTAAKVGLTTDGGGTAQQYNGVGGFNWSSGGLIATADYARVTAISARQRPFVSGLNGSATLVPEQKQFSSIVSAHQRLTNDISLLFDGQYSRRTSQMSYPYTVGLDARTTGSIVDSKVETFTLTPSLRITLPAKWQLNLTAGYGQSTTEAPGTVFNNRATSSLRQVDYRDTLASVEAFAEGPVLGIPGGDIRLAFGGGYRQVGLSANSRQTVGATTTQVFDFDRHHNVTYGFGELSVPLVGQNNSIPFISALKATAAVRYENYRSVGDFFAPRAGLVYNPVRDVSLKFNWGKSFKAPTLYNQYRGYQTILLPASAFGPSAAPAGSTVVYTGGANPDLKPETAENWTATVAIAPRFAPGLKLEGSYFHVSYRGRVGTPITSLFGAIANPLYTQQITIAPTLSQIAARTSGSLLGLENFTGSAYDPASVYAIVENVSQNIARQQVNGVDISANYIADLTDQDSISLQASATYLESKRQLLAGLPLSQAAGTIFNPPHWRGTGGVSWQHNELTLSGFGNYTGGTLDNRLSPNLDVGSFLSFDVTAQWKVRQGDDLLHGVDFLFSINNLFNRRAAKIRNTSASDPSYDSTNYPVTGRAISLTVRKAW